MIGTSNEQNRHEWVVKQLKKLPKEAKLIDVGAGECQYKKYCDHLIYTSQDFCQYDPKNTDASGLHPEDWDHNQIDIVSDINEIPEKDESFDVVLCTEVLEHVPDPVKSLKELCRLLKPGGLLILTAPFCSATHFAPYHFSTGFNIFFYERHLKSLGCSILELENNGNFFEYLAQEIHRIPNMANQYAATRLSWFAHYIIKKMVRILQKLNNKQKDSHEFMCWGYHCLAEKN